MLIGKFSQQVNREWRIYINLEREQPPSYAHHQGTVDTLQSPNETYDLASPPSFEAVNTCHCLIIVICLRNTPKIVLRRTPPFGPAYRFPLQQIVRHQVALLIA